MAIYITLQIPLTSFWYKFNVYRVLTFPLNLPNSTDHSMQLRDDAPGVAVDEILQHYYYLTDLQMADITVHHHQVPQKIFLTLHSPSCLMAILQDHHAEVNALCAYDILTNSNTPRIFHIVDSQYLLFNINSYQIVCQEIAQTKIGCKNCIIEVPHQCSLEHDLYLVPPTQKWQLDSTKIETAHVTNLPLLLKFANNETFTMLQQTMSGSTFLTSEAQIVLPEFKFFEHNITSTLATDNRLKLDFSKVSDAVKKDEILINDIGQAIVLGRVAPFTDDWDFWVSLPGIVNIGSVAACVVLTVASFACIVRLRKLTVMVLLLQAKIKSTEAQVTSLIFDFANAKSLPPQNLPASNITVVTFVSEFWTHIFLGATSLALLVLLLKYLHKKLCAAYSFNHKTTIIVEISYKATILTLPIKYLNGKPTTYEVKEYLPLESPSVSGIFCPRFNFQCKAIVQSFPVSHDIHMPDHIDLNFFNAIFVRYLLARQPEFEMFWVYKRQKYVFFDTANTAV